MEMTVSQQGGDGCSGSNEKQSRLERQLEWSRRIGIDELKRIYGASLFLKCMADLFHLLALLALCIGVTPVFLYSSCPYTLARLGVAPILMEMNPNADIYPVWTLLCIVGLILAQYLKRMKMPSPCRIMFNILQIGLAAAAAYFFCIQAICYIVVGGYDIYYVWDHFCLPFIVFFILYLLLEANYAMLGYSRSRQARIFAVVLSLVWGIAGLAAMIILPIFPAVAVGGVLLMAGVFWIAAFSKIRYQLFRTDALSHKQLHAMLKQKKRNVQGDELVIPEDSKDISRKKFRQGFAWFSLACQLFTLSYAFLFLFAANYPRFLRKAADLGYAPAQYKVGVSNYRERNYAEAGKWFREAAERGNGKAQFKLGVCYAAGMGVRQDRAEAAKWYRKAAEQQDTALKKEYSSIAVLELAEIYVVLGEYDRAISCLDDPRLRQDQNDRVRCLRAYLKACALLVKGQNAEAEMREFDRFFPEDLKIHLAWNVTAFRLWLKIAELSDQARKTISEMTDRVANGK